MENNLLNILLYLLPELLESDVKIDIHESLVKILIHVLVILKFIISIKMSLFPDFKYVYFNEVIFIVFFLLKPAEYHFFLPYNITF